MDSRLRSIVIARDANVRHAMQALDDGGVEIALVIDEKTRLIGTVTDGDIRRGLLKGAGLDSPVWPYVQREFIAVTPAVGRAEVLDLMRARSIAQVPIVDLSNQVVGIHLMREMLGAVERPNWAVIMAGGRGERLRPITDTLPKPMVRIAGRPILERLVLHLVGFGIRRIFLAVNYKSEIIEEYFGDGHQFGCSISYLKEQQPLGTGGALSLLPDVPENPILVMNGDLLTQLDVGAMFEFHKAGQYAATLAVHDYVHSVPYGLLEIDNGLVRGVKEKPVFSWRANAGIYILQPPLLERVPKERYFSMPGLVEDCLDRGESVGAFAIDSDWLDIGRPQELSRARGEGEPR